MWGPSCTQIREEKEERTHTGQQEQQSETCGCEYAAGHCLLAPTKSVWHNPLDPQQMVCPFSSGRNGRSPASSHVWLTYISLQIHNKNLQSSNTANTSIWKLINTMRIDPMKTWQSVHQFYIVSYLFVWESTSGY